VNESLERKIELTTIQAKILEVLGVGKENATRLDDLQKRLGISERKIRIAIEAMRNEGYLILVPSSPPWGYFLAQSQDEVQEFINYFRSRVIDECKIMRSIKLASQKKFTHQFGQIKMFN
jgi:biotin operon repressor